MSSLNWIDDDHLEMGDTLLRAAMGPGPSTDEQLVVKKPRALVEAYVALLADDRFDRIVELGINQGGSTALVSHLADPDKLVAVELSDEPIEALDNFIERRGLGTAVRTYYGVNQADRSRLTQIIEEEFGGQPLDLVIDDASHLPDETHSSFETLFPYLRPGGVLLIEDWRWDHLLSSFFVHSLADPSAPDHSFIRDGIAEAARDPSSEFHDPVRQALVAARDDPRSPWHETAVGMAAEVDPALLEAPASPQRGGRDPSTESLTPLVVELVLAAACSPDVVSEIVVNEWWVAVRRGPTLLDPDSFRLANLYVDNLGLIRR